MDKSTLPVTIVVQSVITNFAGAIVGLSTAGQGARGAGNFGKRSVAEVGGGSGRGTHEGRLQRGTTCIDIFDRQVIAIELGQLTL
jgi:hypothetical protein